MHFWNGGEYLRAGHVVCLSGRRICFPTSPSRYPALFVREPPFLNEPSCLFGKKVDPTFPFVGRCLTAALRHDCRTSGNLFSILGILFKTVSEPSGSLLFRVCSGWNFKIDLGNVANVDNNVSNIRKQMITTLQIQEWCKDDAAPRQSERTRTIS